MISEQSRKYLLDNFTFKQPLTVIQLNVFFELGGNVDYIDEYKRNLLDIACQNPGNNIEIFKILTDKGYSVYNIFDYCCLGNLNKVKEIINSNKDLINSMNDKGKTLLHIAAKYGYYDICKFLVDSGIDVNILDNHDDNAIVKAIQRGHANIVQLLVDNNSNIDIQGKTGLSARDWCEKINWISKDVKRIISITSN